MSKISPLYDMMNKNLVQHGVFHNLLSIDESMVPYYGRHSAKMFIRGKPIRFGYKIWSLCGSDGYPYHLKIYQGKENNPDKLPLGTKVINDLVDIVTTNSDITCHELYFDNFFTSYSLLSDLSNKGIRATGTLRETRIAHATKKLVSSKDLKKKERGTFDFCSDGNVFVAKWHDNAIVTIASNWENHLPVRKVRRRVKGGEKQVTQPHLVNSYNKGMGGVDLMDRLAATYRPNIKGKKWYWPLFMNILNVSIVAAWRQYYKSVENPMSHLEFQRDVTICLLKAGPQRARNELPRTLPDDVRYDVIDHILGSTTQGRCKVCSKNTKNMCKKCNVRLHTERGKECFGVYHRR